MTKRILATAAVAAALAAATAGCSTPDEHPEPEPTTTTWTLRGSDRDDCLGGAAARQQQIDACRRLGIEVAP